MFGRVARTIRGADRAPSIARCVVERHVEVLPVAIDVDSLTDHGRGHGTLQRLKRRSFLPNLSHGSRSQTKQVRELFDARLLRHIERGEVVESPPNLAFADATVASQVRARSPGHALLVEVAGNAAKVSGQIRYRESVGKDRHG